MIKKYIFFLISICIATHSYAQTVTEEFYDDEQEGYVAHDVVPAVNGAETTSSLNQFKKDESLTEDENTLIQAVFSNDFAAVEAVLNKGVTPNIIYTVKLDNGSSYKTTLLHIAIAGNDREILKKLLSYDNVSINQLGFSSITKWKFHLLLMLYF